MNCIHKVRKLPSNPEPDAIYLVELEKAGLVEYYVTTDTGEVRRLDASDSLGWHCAAENINGRRLVVFGSNGKIRACSPEDGDIADGFVRGAVRQGKRIEVFASGICPGMGNLTAGRRYFSGAKGVFSKSPSESGVSQVAGRAISQNTILVRIERPVVLL